MKMFINLNFKMIHHDISENTNLMFDASTVSYVIDHCNSNKIEFGGKSFHITKKFYNAEKCREFYQALGRALAVYPVTQV